jgi:hypothetical protein
MSADVPVLLATRDVAYAQAASLGWDDLRLLAPREPERAVRAVLAATAAARGVEDRDAWVERRAEWVTAVLSQDSAVGETPLMPVLLALLAADRGDGGLPETRAEILHAIVEAVVRRREARRDLGLRVATLGDRDSADAVLAAFAMEARVLADSGGQAAAAAVREAVTSFLSREWGLPAGAAASGAGAILHFWDEIGIFVMRGAEQTVTPRLELLLDIGDAIQASTQPPEAVAAWVSARIAGRRHEPLILAAALSEAAGERLLAAACESREHDLLTAAGAAVRQHARVSATDQDRLVAALADDAAIPDRQGWRSFSLMLDLLDEHSTVPDPGELLIRYPSEYQDTGTAAAALRRTPDAASETVLLDALRVRRLPRLPPRRPAAGPSGYAFPGDPLDREVTEAAARRLLGRAEEATGLVLELLGEGSISMGQHRRLLAALTEAGLADAAKDAQARQWRQWRQLADAAAGLRAYEDDVPERFLSHLMRHPRAVLTDGQAARLDELATLCQTLDLHMLGGYPRRQEFDAWLAFADVICTLGGFDLPRLAAEAGLAWQRIEQSGSDAFDALAIASPRRSLTRWHDIGDPEEAARALAQGLFMGEWTALIAASALSACPPGIAIPLLEDALPRLEPSREHQHSAADALARLKSDEPLAGWAGSDSPALRLVAAERLPSAADGELSPLLCQLTRDPDLAVADAAVRNIGGARITPAAAQLEAIASAPRQDWTCPNCGSANPGSAGSCAQCHVVPPDPAKTAREMLNESAALAAN